MKKVLLVVLCTFLIGGRLQARMGFGDDRNWGNNKKTSYNLVLGVLLTTVGTYLTINGFRFSAEVNKSFKLKEINWGKAQNSSGNWEASCSGVVDNTGDVPVTINLTTRYYTTGYSYSYESSNITVNPGESQGWVSSEYWGSYEPTNVSVKVNSVSYDDVSAEKEKQHFSNQAAIGIAVAGLGVYLILDHFVQKTRFAERTGIEIQTAALPGYWRFALAKRF